MSKKNRYILHELKAKEKGEDKVNCVPIRVMRLKNCVYIVVPTHWYSLRDGGIGFPRFRI